MRTRSGRERGGHTASAAPCAQVRLKEERIKYWLSVGAQPTRPVQRLLGMASIIPQAPFRPMVMVPPRPLVSPRPARSLTAALLAPTMFPSNPAPLVLSCSQTVRNIPKKDRGEKKNFSTWARGMGAVGGLLSSTPRIPLAGSMLLLREHLLAAAAATVPLPR